MYKDFKDYYSLLEIEFSASEAEIKTAYRKKARDYHPDLHPEETAYYTGLFQEITEAYETLSDPEKKMTYDFRYRQMVLGQGPQYEYYEDDTPENTTQYKHTYTRRFEGSFPVVRILVLGLLAFQLYRAVSQTAEVEPARYSGPPMTAPAQQPITQDFQNLLEHNSAANRDSVVAQDSVLFMPVTHP